MTDTVFLKSTINKSGIKLGYIASKLGITREGLYNKLANNTEFKASEIRILQDVLSLSNQDRDRIFFAETVE